MRIEVIGIRLPLIRPGDDLAEVIVKSARSQGVEFVDGDILVITQKIVSKSLGLLVSIDSIKPSRQALSISKKTGLDPRFVELVLRECDRVVAVVPIRELVDKGVVDLTSLAENAEVAKKLLDEYPYFFVVEKEGMLWSDSGIDSSNAPPGVYVVPPRNHDEEARKIHEKIRKLTGSYIPVVICDTELFLGGSMDFARGCWGLDPVDRHFGALDLYGKPKYGGVDLIAHELCAAAALVMKQTGEGIPVAVIRGVSFRKVDRGMRDLMPRADLGKALVETLKATIRVLGLKTLINILKTLFEKR
ncbi:MAG: coenzyme F420-0:L-glutamate ligase [Thermoprotei archaeon]